MATKRRRGAIKYDADDAPKGRRRVDRAGGGGGGGGASGEGEMGAVERELVAFLQSCDDESCTTTDLVAHFGEGRMNEVGKAATVLMRMHRMSQVHLHSGETGGAEVTFRLQTEDKAAKFRDLGSEHMLVYESISGAADKGIPIDHLARETKLPTNHIRKLLTTLTSRRLIKSIKPLQHKNKNYYLLWEIEPPAALTGGVFYTADRELDEEFMDGLRAFVQKALKSGPRTVLEVTHLVAKVGITTVSISEDDMRQVFDTLVYDGTIEPVGTTAGLATSLTKYREAPAVIVPQYLTAVPCGTCPVRAECRPDGAVSPATCIYIAQWLDL